MRLAGRAECDLGSASMTRAARVALVALVAGAGAWFLVTTSPPTTTSIDQVAVHNSLAVYIREHTAAADEVAIVAYGGATYFYSRPAAIGYTQAALLTNPNASNSS